MKRPSPLTLRAGSPSSLGRYVATQLNNMFPASGIDADLGHVLPAGPAALDRMRPILLAARPFEPDSFDHFHSLQYSTWLYLLGNELWRQNGDEAVTARVFCLNRALNAVDLFHAVSMPEIFLLNHALGTVLGNSTYGNRLVVSQNVTVGRVGIDRPTIGDNVVLYPGAKVTGRATIGDNAVLSAMTIVHNAEVPKDTVAFMNGGELAFKPRRRDYISLYFRNSG